MRLPKQLVLLGQCLELDTTTWEWTWLLKDQMDLYSNPGGNILAAVYRPVLIRSKKKPSLSASALKKSKNLYTRFQDYYPDSCSVKNFAEPKLKRVGTANCICYRSSKFGRRLSYKHDFRCKPSVYIDNDLPHVIIIKSDKLRVTKRGIEG